MIDIAITPTTIISGRPTNLRLIVHNVDNGACIDIVLRIALPLGLRMVGGSGRLRIPRLDPESSHEHTFRVVARQPGQYHVTAPNFSYQDAMGRSRHVQLGGWTLAAVVGSASQAPSRSAAPHGDHRADPDRPSVVPRMVFISYRQDDTWELADHIHGELRREFGADRIYLDRRNRQLGIDFRDRLTAALDSTSVMIILIGRDWNPAQSATGLRRLDDPHDYVRREIETGLQTGIPVIPVLVGGTPMPGPQSLPENIRAVSTNEYVEYHRIGGEYAIEEIVEAIRPYLLDASA